MPNYSYAMRSFVAALLVVLMAMPVHAQSGWRPAPGPLITRWGAEVTPENVHPEYPRPQMVRPEWRSLNGLWDYAIRPEGGDAPEDRVLLDAAIRQVADAGHRRLDAASLARRSRDGVSSRPSSEGRSSGVIDETSATPGRRCMQ